jgi:DNA-binding transcriptional LysR family regulator
LQDHLDLRLLSQFMAISRATTMAAAARELGCSVPAISQIVQRLERDAGATLFERTPRGLRLTPAGGLLRDRAGGLLQAEAELLHDLVEYRAHLLPHLRIYMADSVARYIITAVVSALRPLVGELEVRSGHTSSYVQDLLTGRIDVLICSEAIEEVPQLDRFRLCTEELVAVIPAAIASRGLPALARELPFIRPSQGSRMDRTAEEYLRREGLAAVHSLECGSIAPTLELVRNGLGWTISTPLYLATYRPEPAQMTYLSLTAPRPERSLYLLAASGRWLDVPATLADRCAAALRAASRDWPVPLRDAIRFDEPAGRNNAKGVGTAVAEARWRPPLPASRS